MANKSGKSVIMFVSKYSQKVILCHVKKTGSISSACRKFGLKIGVFASPKTGCYYANLSRKIGKLETCQTFFGIEENGIGMLSATEIFWKFLGNPVSRVLS